MILSYNRLMDLVKTGVVRGESMTVSAASIDVRIGNTIMIESPAAGIIDLTRPNSKYLSQVELRDTGYLVRPGQVILANTIEILNMPNNLVCHFILKSSIARYFFNQMQACHADPGFRGPMTLELKNDNEMHSIRLVPGIPIGQLVFYDCDPVPDHANYSFTGQYNTAENIPIQSKGTR